MKKHNFNAGPSILADEVIEKAAQAVLDFNGTGLSVLSISHRSKDFDAVMEEADRLYGVTMQEKGVSKVLELDLDEAARQIEEDDTNGVL